jgi:hypothetical protein
MTRRSSTRQLGQPDDLYRIVFKKGSSRELMTMQSGELSGLFTTTCVEKGTRSTAQDLLHELISSIERSPAAVRAIPFDDGLILMCE